MDIAETAKDPYAFFVSRMEHEQVREAIQQLPLDVREVIPLREFEELSYRKIATILDCPAGTVMSRLARARAKLRTLLSAAILTEGRPLGEIVLLGMGAIKRRCHKKKPVIQRTEVKTKFPVCLLIWSS